MVRYTFGDFVLDVGERSLRRRGSTTPVALQPKTFDLLVFLVTHAGRLHTKQALLDEVWSNVVVTESSLTRSIHQLRTALDDTADEPRFVETVPRVGYRFIAPVNEEPVSTPASEAAGIELPAPPTPRIRRVFIYGLVALAGIAIAFFIVDRVWLKRSGNAELMPSVAVLPFKNIGNDPSNEALADGVAETLLTMLAQIRELRVIARTSSFSFKDKDVDLRTIGEALGADAILEGSVQRSGERIRINAQLNSAADGVHLWAENFERPVSDIFAVQDEIARRVAEALKITLAGNIGPGSAGTQSFEAYELTLEAKRLLATRQSVNREKAIPLLERAVQLDPNYGDAWVGLFYAYPDDNGKVSDAAMAAMERALEVAPNTSGPHLARGFVLMYSGDPGAAAAMARGLELAPQDSFALSSAAAEYRMGSERYAEAAALMRRALTLDPRSANTHFGAALAFEANDDRAGALAQIREALRLEPNMGQAYYVGGGILYGSLGRMDEALRFMRRARVLEPTYERLELVLGYALIGEHEQAARELEAERQIMNPDLYAILRAQLDLLAGRDEATQELLTRALTSDPAPYHLLVALDELSLTTTPDVAQRMLDRLSTVNPDWLDQPAEKDRYVPICTVAWSGRRTNAAALLARWEPYWRKHLPYSMGTGNQNVGTQLARAFACNGRNEEALAELERIVAWGYHAGGWRGLAADRAYDGIRSEPRFITLLERSKTVAEAERQRFLARPDLEDADIDALVD
jgi:TolB-like protein/DNA-binding winged helix-turn-helix (wHTH) protein/tetratricopeptide (TPR) repeat protein